jgi:hypothetical protein
MNAAADPAARWWAKTPDRRTRLAAALLLGALAVLVFWAHTTWGPAYVRGKAGDLAGPLEGARRILAGQHNIYAEPYAPYASKYALSYPLTASFLVLPLAALPPPVAAMLFIGISTAAAAFVLSRRRLDDLLLFASAPAFFAWSWAQWSPLLLIQGVAAWTVIIGIGKPQMGAVMFAYRPHWRGAALAALAGLATLAWSPTWPLDWLRGSFQARDEVTEHAGALAAPGGFLLLLAAWKWRDPRARLLLALAIIPNRLWFYDQLALGLVPENTRRRLAWVLCSWLAAGGWALARHLTDGEARFALEALIIALVYGPALFFVLKPAPGGLPPATASAAIPASPAKSRA